jgi:uncharacterized protein YrrD
MLKSDQLIGKPVLSRDGQKLDTVQGVVADQMGKKILAMLVEDKSNQVKAIPFGGIERIGQDAVIVAQGVEGMAVDAWPELATIVAGKRPYRGRDVITSNGEQVAKLHDLYFDETSGQIVGFEISQGALSDVSSGRSFVSADGANLGDSLIIEASAFANRKSQGGLNEALSKAGGFLQAAASRVSNALDTAKDKLETNQKKFVIGKVASSDVRSSSGELIVASGQTIATIDAERALSTGTLQALFLSASGASLRDAFDRAKESASSTINRLKTEKTSTTVSPALEATLGYMASRTVIGADGTPIVSDGETITMAMIERAEREQFSSDLINAVFGELNPKTNFDQVPEPKADPAPLTLDTDGNPNVNAEEEIALREKAVQGQVAQITVLDSSGNPIVTPGKVVTAEAVEHAKAESMLPELNVALEDQKANPNRSGV